MAKLTEARTIEVDIDTVQDWQPDIRLNAGDVDGRIIRAVITDDRQNVNEGGLTARLLFNAFPGSRKKAGGYVTMTAVPGQGTATFEAAVPRAALAGGTCALGVELTDSDGSIVCTRTFNALVEPSVLNLESEEGEDALKELHSGIDAMHDGTVAAGQAAGQALLAASKAQEAAKTAETAASLALKAGQGISLGPEPPLAAKPGHVWLVESQLKRKPLYPGGAIWPGPATYPERPGRLADGCHKISAIRRYEGQDDHGQDQWTGFKLDLTEINKEEK